MAAPKTVATYDLNGTQREFDFSFDYLSRTFVQVTLIGMERRVLALGTDFTFVGNTRIRTGEIYGPPEWTQIEIRRVTSTTERLVDFQDASILRADDLNLSDLQVLHVAEEAREAATETIGTNNFGHLDARGRRIVNGAGPVGLSDFTTKNYVDNVAGGVGQARDQAVAARDAAQGHAAQAGVHSANALTRANAAEQSATQSAQSASSSATSSAAANAAAVAAKASEQGALSHKNDALAAAGSSRASELKAKDWAEKITGTVEPGAYSAKYWAQQSANISLPDGYISQAKLDGQLAMKVNNGQEAFDRNWRGRSVLLPQDTNPDDVQVSGQYDLYTIHGPLGPERVWYYLEVQQHSNNTIHARQRMTVLHGGGVRNGMVWERVVIPGGETTRWRPVALSDLPISMYIIYDMITPTGSPVSTQWLSVRRDGSVRQGGTFVLGPNGPIAPRVNFRQPVSIVMGISITPVGVRGGYGEANSTITSLDNSGFTYHSGQANECAYLWSMEGYLDGLI